MDNAKAINSTMEKAIANALGGYDVQKAIQEKITSDIAVGAIAEALDEAILSVDKAELVSVLANELSRSVTSAVALVIREAMADILCGIRGVSSYDTEARSKIRSEFMAVLQRGKREE